MKKRLIAVPFVAMIFAGCGPTTNPGSDTPVDPGTIEPQDNPEEKPHENPEDNPDPVVPTTKVLTGIEVSTPPTKTVYKVGESFDPSGMVVKAVYDDGSKEIVTNYQLSNLALTVNTTKVTITYEGKTVDVAITVNPLSKYTVTFMANETDKIKDVVYTEGEIPSLSYSVPSTAEYDFTFLGWSSTPDGQALSSLPAVSQDVTYYAVLKQTKRKYSISFKNENGSAYKTVSVEYGAVPTVTNPTKAKDQQYSYSFVGWSTTKGGEALDALPAVTGAATYYAVFGKTLNKYSIKLHLNYGDPETVITLTEDYGTQFEDFDSVVPQREGYHFAGWCSDKDCNNKITFPVTLSKDTEYYAKWNEKVDIVPFLRALLGIKDYDPYSFVPESLRPDYEDNLVALSDLLDYSTSRNVSAIKTEGFGEQWQMVIDNMEQSEKFYAVLTATDSVFAAALTAFINHFEDNAHQDETSYEEEVESSYAASCSFESGVLNFSLEFKKSILGVTPKIEMSYAVSTAEKVIKIAFNEDNILKCKFTDNEYLFGISYGAEILGKKGLRTAYTQLNKIVNPDDEDDIKYEGHVSEQISYINDESSKTLINSAADFYIDDKYCTVVGNKASGLIGFAGYINELYDVETGKRYGYMVQEEREIPVIGGELVYHTFWFNLEDISGVTSVKAVDKKNILPNENPDYVYLNGSEDIFTPAYNKVLIKKTSRKYDVEMRDHYYYVDKEGEITKEAHQIPMMFIQDDDSYYDNGYSNDNFSSFSEDMNKESGISGAAVILSSTIVNKIRQDNISLVEVFKENVDNITAETISNWLK